MQTTPLEMSIRSQEATIILLSGPTMAPQHTILLLIISAFFSKALAIQCYGCTPDATTGSCTLNYINCGTQCGAMTTSVYTGDSKQSQSMRACADSYPCLTGSINYGQSRMTFNVQCCNTNYCNNQNAAELSRRPPSGKICHTCEKSDCSKMLSCEGDETQCFTSTVTIDGKKETQKGCSSKVFCGSNAYNISALLGASDIKCCEGNLCNSAQSIGGFLLPVVSLISILLF